MHAGTWLYRLPSMVEFTGCFSCLQQVRLPDDLTSVQTISSHLQIDRASYEYLEQLVGRKPSMGILFSSGAQKTAYEVQQGHNLEGTICARQTATDACLSTSRHSMIALSDWHILHARESRTATVLT